MRILTTTIAVLALGALSSYGQGADISGFGSYWDTDELGEAWGGGARLRFGPASPVDLELRGTYFEDLTGDEGPGDVELEAIPVDLGLSLSLIPDETFDVYIAGGGTWYFLDSDLGDVDDELGWYAGAGAEFALTARIALFAEYLYRDVEATAENDDTDAIDDDVDIDLAGSVVNIGLVFR